MTLTVKQQLNQKSEAVKIVLRAFATKQALEVTEPDWNRYGAEALAWWEESCRLVALIGMTEEELAADIIRHMRAMPVWGRILREGTQ